MSKGTYLVCVKTIIFFLLLREPNVCGMAVYLAGDASC